MQLDLKVPPDVVALVVAALMWLIAAVTPSLAVPSAHLVPAAVALLVVGLTLIVAARVGFARVGTTFSPVAPGRSECLVTTGVYRLTRNPMYLGTLIALLAFAVALSNAFAAVASALYAVYMNRFQIAPEERVLRERFGLAYEEYASRVRRWV